MSIIPNIAESDNSIFECCQPFLQRFKVNSLLRKCNVVKKCGHDAYRIFSFLTGLVFEGMNFYTLAKHSPEKVAFGKDAVYRFLNQLSVNWERFTSTLAHSVVKEVDRLTSEDRRTALVVDDSPYYRNRSKKVEMLSRCYDHVERKYYKGFSLLAMGWTDGQTFLPVDFRLLASGKDENLLEGSHVKVDRRTVATNRRTDARKEKPGLVLEMLGAVKGTPAQARYVLFDSWFASPSAILDVKALGFDVVARLKNFENYRYRYQGETLSLKKIHAANRKRRGRSRYLLSVTVTVRHKEHEDGVPAKIVFVRDKGNRKKWIALVSTDTSLDEDGIVSLYSKRWDIEPFFKVCKQYLRLTKEFQSRSFDSMAAHTAVVFTRYLILSLENRENRDERSICELFFVMCKEMDDKSFAYAFALITSALSQSLRDHLLLSRSQVDAFVGLFISQLPASIADKLSFSRCES